jgi:iron complex transport system substrate-binding protein
MIKPGILAGLIITGTVTAFLTGCTVGNGIKNSAGVPSRIVSLAPSITETLFALGAGDRVVGVTRYCLYPPQARNRAQVGGYTDPNYELLLSLKPDLVILLKEHEPVKGFLKANNIRFFTIDNHDIAGIIASVDTMGRICGLQKAADSISGMLRQANVRDTSKCRPKILISVGRDMAGNGTIGEVWAAGRNSIFNEIIEACGGENIIVDSSVDYPTLSGEGLLRLQPDMILEVTNHIPDLDPDNLKKDWEKLQAIPAVRNDMIFFLNSDYVTVPGPRTVLLYRDIRRILGSYKCGSPI